MYEHFKDLPSEIRPYIYGAGSKRRFTLVCIYMALVLRRLRFTITHSLIGIIYDVASLSLISDCFFYKLSVIYIGFNSFCVWFVWNIFVYYRFKISCRILKHIIYVSLRTKSSWLIRKLSLILTILWLLFVRGLHTLQVWMRSLSFVNTELDIKYR